jgi:hypothetical protein
LAWVVGFPLYLYRRKGMGLRNLLALGAVPVIGFAMSYVVLVSSVGHQRGVPEASVYEQSIGIKNRIGS